MDSILQLLGETSRDIAITKGLEFAFGKFKNLANSLWKRGPLGKRGSDVTDPSGNIEDILERFGHDREVLLEGRKLPKALRIALAEPDLRELSGLLKARKPEAALHYAEDRLRAIDCALREHDTPGTNYAAMLRTHQQRLLCAAATAAAWLGEVERGRVHWDHVKALGLMDAEHDELVASTLFNVGLKEELRDHLDAMGPDCDVYRKSAPLLAFLEQDWATVDRLLANAERADELLLRVKARLDLIDFENTITVRKTSDLLDKTDQDDALPLVNLTRARLTFELTQRVLRGYTPLEFDRRPLIDNLVRRLGLAVETTKRDSQLYLRALAILGMAAELVRDNRLKRQFEKRVDCLDEKTRYSLDLTRDPELTPGRIHDMLKQGQIETTQAAILKAERYRVMGQTDKAEAILHEALFSTDDKRHRANVLYLLTHVLRQDGRIENARRLIKCTPLRPADKWLLTSINLPEGITPLDMADEVSAFPLDIDVIERLAVYALSLEEAGVPGITSDDQTSLKGANKALHWTGQLIKILPSVHSRRMYAEALYRAGHYSDLIVASQDLNPENSELAAQYEGWAQMGLRRFQTAADVFIDATKAFPGSDSIAVSAAAALLADHRPQEAVGILESHITDDCRNTAILVAYAKSLRHQDPASDVQALRAFKLLDKAYKLRPDPRIAMEAWQAAKAAGRGAEARQLFREVLANRPVRVIESEDDLQEALKATEQHGVVQIEEGFKHLAELLSEGRKRSEILNMLLDAHALSYTDFFRHSNRSWELWADWTQQFEQRHSRGEASHRAFSIVADWPTSRGGQLRGTGRVQLPMLLDQTAILTLGVLGPDSAKQILAALETSFILKGTLKEMQHTFSRIKGELLASNASLHVRVIRTLSTMPQCIVEYSADVEAAAPKAPELGQIRVDLGVAVKECGRYVTDLGESEAWSDEIRHLRISSAVLLASLHTGGLVTRDLARAAAFKCPSAFQAWDNATAIPIPDIVVFDEHSALDWCDVGLLGKLGNRVRIGPWAWACISGEARQHESLKVAHQQLRSTLAMFRSAIQQETIVEIPPETSDEESAPQDEEPNKSSATIKQFWAGALDSIRTAQANGLQLWADDRFYPLLLTWGGPVNLYPQIGAICSRFKEWAGDCPPISTQELLGRLSDSRRMPPTAAQGAAQELFVKGYRPVHPILLADAIRQYTVPNEVTLTPPFQELVDAITTIPQYLTDLFTHLYGNRDGYIRILSLGVAKRLIVSVWDAKGLSNDQRSALASAFLATIEYIWVEASSSAPRLSSNNTPIAFWQGLGYALLPGPEEGIHRFDRQFDRLRWLGQEAASRTENRHRIIQLLEDNIIDFLKHILRVLEDTGPEDHLPQSIGSALLPAMIPLVGTTLINWFDPLLRRTVGVLAGLSNNGRIHVHYDAAVGNGAPLIVSDEENERATAGWMMRAARGDPRFTLFLQTTDFNFTYEREAPQEWIDGGFPVEERINIDVKCSLFTLLWADFPELRELVVNLLVYHLSVLDPALAHEVILAKDVLLGHDSNRAQIARNRVAVAMLKSGYFDLRRDLTHAVKRIRHYSTVDLAGFIGWIGRDAALAVASHPLNSNIQVRDQQVWPMAHFLGRALLTSSDDDQQKIQQWPRAIAGASGESDENNDSARKLTNFLTDKAILAETADDPFVAAWALRTVLSVISMTEHNPELDVNGHVTSATDWAIGYMETVLGANLEHSANLKQLILDRQLLAHAALQLAAYATSGRDHSQTWDQDIDPMKLWLEWTWLLATKLHISLVGLWGGLANAVQAAEAAVYDLGLSDADIPAHDAFDALIFGGDSEDVGTALALTAILKVARCLPETEDRPLWWTDTIQRRVEELAKARLENSVTGSDDLGNCFGLIAPLRVQVLARELLATFAAWYQDGRENSVCP